MDIYIITEAIIGIIAGLLLAVCTKREKNVIYGKLDRAGQITNILLLLVYVCFSYFYMGLALFANPRYDTGILGLLGWTIAILMASAALVCGVGLGLSVAFRKKGKSKLSFAVQFAGVGAIALTIILFFLFYGNLLKPIN